VLSDLLVCGVRGVRPGEIINISPFSAFEGGVGGWRSSGGGGAFRRRCGSGEVTFSKTRRSVGDEMGLCLTDEVR
jgi:hypothetical protein